MRYKALRKKRQASNIIPFPVRPEPRPDFELDLNAWLADGRNDLVAFLLGDGSIEIRNASGQVVWTIRRAA